jgi:hypothetical protein
VICDRRFDLGGAAFKPRDLGSDRGYRAAMARAEIVGIDGRSAGSCPKEFGTQEMAGTVAAMFGRIGNMFLRV